MARLGVTYQDIAQAASQLIEESRQPTIETIRQILGTGSSTTIANHLRKWRSQQEGAMLAEQEHLPPEMLTVIKGLWERLVHQAQERVTVLQTAHQQESTILQQDLQKYKNNNQRWQQLFNQWTREKEQFEINKITLGEAIQSLQKEQQALLAKHQTALQQLQEKQARIDELNRLHLQFQANLEHYRESAREQRMIEQQQFEQQKQELQFEIKNVKEQNVIAQEKYSTLSQDYQLLKQSYSALEKSAEQTTARLDKQEIKVTELKQALQETTNTRDHWQREAQQLQKVVDGKMAQAIEDQIQIKLLTQQLETTRELLNDATEKNKLFGHEKWILTQEKSHLEGQLKQLQEMMVD